MKRNYRLALAAASALSVAMAAGQAFAQQLGKQIMGGWTLVSAHNEKDGKKTEVFGSNPAGYLNFSDNGRFTFQVYKTGLPKFAAKERVNATPAEAASVIHNSISYFGTYKVNESDGTVNWNIEQSTFPNNVGQGKRMVKLSGDQLTLMNPAPSYGGMNVFVFKRAK